MKNKPKWRKKWGHVSSGGTETMSFPDFTKSYVPRPSTNLNIKNGSGEKSYLFWCDLGDELFSHPGTYLEI